MKQIKLSPSKLNLFTECNRCFHDAYSDSKCPRPRGIFPSLPGGMDLIMKKHVDNYRGSLPPELMGILPGVLFSSLIQMNRWRYWGTGPKYTDEVNDIVLAGALDDCLVDDGFYIPLDWKTKGSEPKDDGSQYYQTQLDCYNLMLDAELLKTRDEGWLVYLYPTKADSIPGGDGFEKLLMNIKFGMTAFKLECSKERAKEKVRKAAECLRGPRPKLNVRCEQCRYIETLKTIPEAE